MTEFCAPTIDSVSVLSASSVSVAFTPHYYNELYDISYMVTSSPGSLIGTGTSSPIIVLGLESNTSYSFTITATMNERTETVSPDTETILISSLESV